MDFNIKVNNVKEALIDRSFDKIDCLHEDYDKGNVEYDEYVTQVTHTLGLIQAIKKIENET